MQTVDTLIFARWIVPVEPSNTVLENHALAINNSKIIEISPAKLIQQKFSARETYYLNNHAIIPGLINSHTHSPMVLFRGLADDLPLMTWLQDYIWPAENKWLTNEFIADGTELAIAEMLRSGTTCFNENYLFPNIIAKTALKMQMRASIGIFLIDAPTAWATHIDEYIEKGFRTFDEYHQQHELLNFSLAPHAPYTMSDDALLKTKGLAEKYQLPIHMHVHETKEEVANSLKQYNKRPLKRLDELGILSNRFQNIHMTQITDEDITILQATKAHVVHCPESNLKLNSGFCPVQKLLDAGINTALGTDGAASNNDLDMFGEMRTAALIGKVVANHPSAVSAMTALEMATINSAKALQLDHKIGSLKPGKAADIIAINMDSLNTTPVYNLISHIVYAINSRQVSHAWVNGQCLLNDNEFTQFNQQEILAKAQKWQEKIKHNQM